MHSCIYEGTIRHRRFRPRPNMFQYRLFFMFLDLAELPGLFDIHPLWSYEKYNIASFRNRDHFGDEAVPLDQAVRDLVEDKQGSRPQGPIRLLTHLRYFGHRFTKAFHVSPFIDIDINYDWRFRMPGDTIRVPPLFLHQPP